jgi:hypothetical protein
MPRPRTPALKAAVTGAAAKNPSRHAGRREPAGLPPLGEPFDYMGGEERAAWALFARELPWLNASHRALVEVAVSFRSRLMKGEPLGVTALNAYQVVLSKLAATPVDATRVTLPVDDQQDETEARYFGPN